VAKVVFAIGVDREMFAVARTSQVIQRFAKVPPIFLHAIMNA
jgi:hypothetical protein